MAVVANHATGNPETALLQGNKIVFPAIVRSIIDKYTIANPAAACFQVENTIKLMKNKIPKKMLIKSKNIYKFACPYSPNTF